VQVIGTSNSIGQVSPGTRGRTGVIAGPQTFRVEEHAFRIPGPDEVRVRIEGCGVCASNLPVWMGQPWFQYPFEPGAPGHEAWGVIDATGENVSGLQAGDRVALLSTNAFAEYDFAPAEHVVKLPSSLGSAPVPAEALGCAVNIFKRSQIRAGETVAIVGIGFLGSLLTRLATNAGATVIAISVRTTALTFAKQFGAAETVRSIDEEQTVKLLKEMTLGSGCDCVIEATGKQGPLNIASEITRELGRLIIAGYHQDGPRQVNMQLWNWRGLTVINAHERNPDVYVSGMKEAVAKIERGELDPSPLYTHRFPLEELPAAFKTLSERPDRFMKALVTL
jgi:threonine dehydrogenase-like Zn-dependent dehydrogenase